MRKVFTAIAALFLFASPVRADMLTQGNTIGGVTISASSMIAANGGNTLGFGTGGGAEWQVSFGNLIPTPDNSWTFGDATHRISTGYFNNLGSASALVNKGYLVSWYAAGSAPTNSGTCAINTQVGGNEAGSFKANGACASGTVILTFSNTATNGRACDFWDMTTPANAIKQTAYTTTTVTASSVTMAAADQIVFKCVVF